MHVRNLLEARLVARSYDAVLTVGPDAADVAWSTHRNHKVVSFEDVPSQWYPEAPTREQISEAVIWGSEQPGSLLIHCHMGISRSTAVAWGVLISRGEEPAGSLLRLREEHPMDLFGERRAFCPNRLIVLYLEEILKVPGLALLRDRMTSTN